MTTPGLPQITPARLPDPEVWESSARDSLLRHLPVRASLIGLVGAGLTTAVAPPASAMLTYSGTTCLVQNQFDLITAMTYYCTSVTLIDSATLTIPLTITKPLTIQETLTVRADVTIDAGTGVTLSSDGVDTGTVVIDSGTVVISGDSAATASITAGSGTDVVSVPMLQVFGSGALNLQAVTVDGASRRPLVASVNANVAVDDSVLRHGRAQSGGAIRVEAGTVVVTNTVLESNTATGSNVSGSGGGAIHASLGSQVVLESSTLSGNMAINSFSGGAVLIRAGSELNTDNSLFSNNTASTAGAVYVDSSGEGNSITFRRTEFSGNSAPNGNGGVMQVGSGSVTIEDSTFAGNSAVFGGVMNGFGIETFTISNSTFVGNSASFVGAFYASSESIAIQFATFLNNTDTSSYVDSIVLRPNGESASIINTVIVDNNPTGSNLYINYGAQPAASVLTMSHVALSDTTTVRRGSPTGPLKTNVTHDVSVASVFGSNGLANNGGPTRTVALIDDPNNLALDGGTAIQGGPSLDQVGAARVSGVAPDLGAFEFQQEPSGGSGDSSPPSTVAPPVEPLLPRVMPMLSLTGSTLTCAVGEFSDAPSHVDVTLVVGGVRQETRRIAMPATTVTWPVDSLWRGQSVGCEVVARVENRVATAYAPGISIPSATTPTPTPTPTPTTPAPTTPADPARGFAAASIRFAPLSSALDAADRRAIASLVEQAGTDATFRVTGYVQAVGSTRNDRALSRARAQAVAAELRRLGVAASNITAIDGGRSQRDGAAARRATITARWTR